MGAGEEKVSDTEHVTTSHTDSPGNKPMIMTMNDQLRLQNSKNLGMVICISLATSVNVSIANITPICSSIKHTVPIIVLQ